MGLDAAYIQAFSFGNAVMAPSKAKALIIITPLIVPKIAPKNLSTEPPPKKTTVSFNDRTTSLLINKTTIRIEKNPKIDLTSTDQSTGKESATK